jgi:nucleoside-diphosphate kinase
MERTFSIIKPDAVKAGKTGAIIQHFIDGGLRPVAFKLVQLTEAQAQGFYAVHKARPFFVVQVLEGENAVAKNRELMGATDSKKAAAGTIRNKFGTDIEKNAVHGSDAPETAKAEIAFFFSGAELAALGVTE